MFVKVLLLVLSALLALILIGSGVAGAGCVPGWPRPWFDFEGRFA